MDAKNSKYRCNTVLNVKTGNLIKRGIVVTVLF
jgi:hypothetical protein